MIGVVKYKMLHPASPADILHGHQIVRLPRSTCFVSDLKLRKELATLILFFCLQR